MTAGATFCATLVDEWIRAGITEAFAAPGSRSTPLVLALANDKRIRLHMFHDERSASFAALGHGVATGEPAVVTCTSGTAAAHFHAAVIEADLSSVPMIVCTTDRPPELIGIGAPQTIDQARLFGSTTRFYCEPGVPDAAISDAWRSMGARLVVEALGASGQPGPVHANLAFRDPLVGEPHELPAGRPHGAAWHQWPTALPGAMTEVAASDDLIQELWSRMRGLPGVIVAGNGTTDPSGVLQLSRRLGWPLLADHQSGCRVEGQSIAHFESLLRSDTFRQTEQPAVVLRFGRTLASKTLSQWIDVLPAEIIAAAAPGEWVDPERQSSVVVPELGLAKGLLGRIPQDYRSDTLATQWLTCDDLAADAISATLAGYPEVTEPDVVRSVVDGLPAGAALMVASSMPVRDLEWFGANRRDLRVFANRGANGIDGLIASSIGVALSGARTTLLIGDVAFLHDCSSLVIASRRPIDLTIVVIDNDGGGIFSFLPQATEVPRPVFEELFGTAHGVDLIALAKAQGIAADPWTVEAFQRSQKQGGVSILVAKTNRDDNVIVHDALHEAVDQALN